MKLLIRKIARFLVAEEGPTAVEYAMLLMLIFLVCISVITVLGQSASTSFNESNTSIEGVLD